MKRKKRKNTKNVQKFVLLILIIVLAILVFYALTDQNEINFKEKNDQNQIINKSEKNVDKKQDNSDGKKETSDNKQKNEKNNSEPKKEEKSEIKQEIQNNVTYSIELIGDEEITLNVGEKYNELGARAKDSNGNDVSSKINIDNSVDTNKKGEYMVIYSIGKSMVVRNVIVK